MCPNVAAATGWAAPRRRPRHASPAALAAPYGFCRCLALSGDRRFGRLKDARHEPLGEARKEAPDNEEGQLHVRQDQPERDDVRAGLLILEAELIEPDLLKMRKQSPANNP